MKFPFLLVLAGLVISQGAFRTFKEHWGTCTSALETREGALVAIGWGFPDEHKLPCSAELCTWVCWARGKSILESDNSGWQVWAQES